MPKCGASIQTTEGPGKVIRQNILEEKIAVILENGKEIEIPAGEIQ
jgi:hypothetical protein